MLGYQDEVWFSRLAQPNLKSRSRDLRAWTDTDLVRLVRKEADKADPDPIALACYGLLRDDTGQMILRFVDGRPVSSVTCRFLSFVLTALAGEGKQALLMVWDNASWHSSKEVRGWIKAHNRRVKQEGGCRLLACRLPSRSPWLNNIVHTRVHIEPKWVHGKRAIVEPDRKLPADELKTRLCDYYKCELLEPITQ